MTMNPGTLGGQRWRWISPLRRGPSGRAARRRRSTGRSPANIGRTVPGRTMEAWSRLLALLFIVLPIVELAVIIQVGPGPRRAQHHRRPAGGQLRRRLAGQARGHERLEAVPAQVQSGVVPGREIADGVLIMLAGALLLTPGFVTDLLGILLLLPPVRADGARRGPVPGRAQGHPGAAWLTSRRASPTPCGPSSAASSRPPAPTPTWSASTRSRSSTPAPTTPTTSTPSSAAAATASGGCWSRPPPAATPRGRPRSRPAPAPRCSGFATTDGFVPDVEIGEGYELEATEFRLLALHTPGVAPDHLCYLLEDDRILLAGDLVRGDDDDDGDPARHRPPADLDTAAWLASIERLASSARPCAASPPATATSSTTPKPHWPTSSGAASDALRPAPTGRAGSWSRDAAGPARRRTAAPIWLAGPGRRSRPEAKFGEAQLRCVPKPVTPEGARCSEARHPGPVRPPPAFLRCSRPCRRGGGGRRRCGRRWRRRRSRRRCGGRPPTGACRRRWPG